MIVWTLVTAFNYFTSEGVEGVRAINTFYCSPTKTNINTVQSVEIVTLSVITGLLLVCSVITFFRDWGTICGLLNARDTDNDGYQDARLLVHASGLALMFIGCLLFIAGTQRKTVAAALLLAGIPLFTAIILGARPDIWPSRSRMKHLFPARLESRVDPFLPTIHSTPASLPVVTIRSRYDAELPPLPSESKGEPSSVPVNRTSPVTPTDLAPPRYSVEERRVQEICYARERSTVLGQDDRWESAV